MDHSAFPHILDAVIGFASYDTLISMRGASQDMRARIDPFLTQRVQVRLPASTIRARDGPLSVTYGASIPLARCSAASIHGAASSKPGPKLPSARGEYQDGVEAYEDVQSSESIIHSTSIGSLAPALARARIVDLHAPTSHWRLWRLYPYLKGVHTVRYLGPDLYDHMRADARVRVAHVLDPFLISLGAKRIVVALSADTPSQSQPIGFPVLRHASKAVVNVWWSPERAEWSAAHRCNLVTDAGIKDLVFICRRKEEDSEEPAEQEGASRPALEDMLDSTETAGTLLGVSDQPHPLAPFPSEEPGLQSGADVLNSGLSAFLEASTPAPRAVTSHQAPSSCQASASSCQLSSSYPQKVPTVPHLFKMGMFRNIFRYGMSHILSPDWTKALTFVGLETVAPAALGYAPGLEPASRAALNNDVLGFILAEGIGGQPPDDYGAAMTLLREHVRFLSHDEYAAEVGREEYEIELLPEPRPQLYFV